MKNSWVDDSDDGLSFFIEFLSKPILSGALTVKNIILESPTPELYTKNGKKYKNEYSTVTEGGKKYKVYFSKFFFTFLAVPDRKSFRQLVQNYEQS